MAEAVALGHALTGEELPLTATDDAGLVAELAALGWDAARLADLRRARQAQRQPWPFPVSLEARREIGFARFDARLAELRRRLGIDGLAPATPARRQPDRDDQRLLADRPPHW